MSLSRRLVRKLVGLDTSMHHCYAENTNINRNHERIADMIASVNPCFIARWGSTELHGYLAKKLSESNIWWPNFLFHAGLLPDWVPREVSSDTLDELHKSSGVYPPTKATYDDFFKEYITCWTSIDLLGSWLRAEKFIPKENEAMNLVPLGHLNPLENLDDSTTWTRALEGKKILIVHPFKTSIEQQYARREAVFRCAKRLPLFDLEIVSPPQAYGGTRPTEFDSWKEALDALKLKIWQSDFDVALLGCGAYGMPLGHYIKTSMGRKAIHLGGVLQLLFGILGTRWEQFDWYQQQITPYWIKPLQVDTPEARFEGERGQNPYW